INDILAKRFSPALFLDFYDDRRALHSFPTRRSSDLNFLRRVLLSMDIAIFLTIKNTVACYSSILAVPLIADVNRPVALAYCILMMHCKLCVERLFSYEQGHGMPAVAHNVNDYGNFTNE